jgi:hypothetical protein
MSFKRTTTTQILDREFQKLGIPYAIEKTGSQHLRWSFAHHGVNRQLVTAGAPRAARAQLRRMVPMVRQIEKRDS